MKILPSILLLLIAAGCSPGYFVWEPAEGRSFSREKLRDDIFECEEYAVTSKVDSDSKRFPIIVPRRDYGGWGDFDFEFCMRQRGWRLEFVPGWRKTEKTFK